MAYPRSTMVYPKPAIPCPWAGGTSSSRIIGHLALIIVIQLLVMVPPSKSEGEIRCYCNEASCVSTSYMCKSALGKCYSQLTYERDNTRSVHGCVESLPQADKMVCSGQGDIVKTKSGPLDWPVLICCHEDMCNYLYDVIPQIPGNSKPNGSIHKAKNPTEGTENRVEHRYPDDAYHDRELWFKAAVIAVPIAGGFILVLLVLLAVRMLRNDSRRHMQLMQMRRHRDVIAKAQLYVADHFCDKNDHHLCFNSLEKPGRTSFHPVYKDVNVKVDIDGCGYEKLNSSFSESGSGKSHSNPAHAVSTVGSHPTHKTAQDNCTKPPTTLHTSSTQTPNFSDSPLADGKQCSDSGKRKSPSHDSVIVWGQTQKKDELGEVV